MSKYNFSNVTESWQKRLVDEYQTLNDRLVILNDSLKKDGFKDKVGEKQYGLLIKQKDAMSTYANVLEERLIDLEIMNK